MSDFLAVAVLEKLLHFDAGALDEVCAGMNVCTIDDQLAEVLDVGLINSFGIGQDLGDVYWDSHLKIEIMCVSNLHY